MANDEIKKEDYRLVFSTERKDNNLEAIQGGTSYSEGKKDFFERIGEITKMIKPTIKEKYKDKKPMYEELVKKIKERMVVPTSVKSLLTELEITRPSLMYILKQHIKPVRIRTGWYILQGYEGAILTNPLPPLKGEGKRRKKIRVFGKMEILEKKENVEDKKKEKVCTIPFPVRVKKIEITNVGIIITFAD